MIVGLVHKDSNGVMRFFQHLAPADAYQVLVEGCGDEKCILHTVVAKVEDRWFVRSFKVPALTQRVSRVAVV